MAIFDKIVGKKENFKGRGTKKTLLGPVLGVELQLC